MGSSCVKCKNVDLNTNISNLCPKKVASEYATTQKGTTHDLKSINSLAGGCSTTTSDRESHNDDVDSQCDLKDWVSDIDESNVDQAKKCYINDICGLVDTKFIVQAGVRYIEVKSLSGNMSVNDFRPLRQECKNGDHYLARYEIHRRGSSVTPGSLRTENNFYVVKRNSCIQVGCLDDGFCDVETKHVFDLHPDCQGGSFYMANRMGFFIIRSEDNTYLQVRDMSKKGHRSSTASRHDLHESFTNGLYYFTTDNFFYIVKEHAEFGLVYHRTKDLRNKEEEDVITVSSAVAKLLVRNPSLHQQGM